MSSIQLRSWIIAISLTGFVHPALAQASLKIQAHLLAEPRAVVSTRDLSQAAELASIDLVRGDPVSLRVILSNAGNEPSVKTVLLNEWMSPLEIWLKRPDGSQVLVNHQTRAYVVRGIPPSGSIPPGGAFAFDTFLYEHLNEDERGNRSLEYLFETPGRYEITVIYKIGVVNDHLLFKEGLISTAPPTATSAPLAVDVLEETIPNWQQFKDAEILTYIGRNDWPALEANSVATQALIAGAARPWLTGWANHVAAVSAEPE